MYYKDSKVRFALLALRKLSLPLVFSVLANTANAGPPPAPAGYKWQQVGSMTDDFNGNSLNRNKWNPSHKDWVGRDPGRFKPSQVTVSGGFARLKNKQVAATNQKVWIHTGFIQSKQKVYPGYYSECRLKAATDGTVTGFWSNGRGTEIDTQEAVGWDPQGKAWRTRQMRYNTHYLNPANDWSTDKKAGGDHNISPGVGEAFHTYGFWWKNPRNVSFYYNGSLVKSVVTGGPLDRGTGAGQYLNMNTETQNWLGNPNLARLNNNNNNTTLIDFVRTWKLVKTSGGGGGGGGLPSPGTVISLKGNNNKFISSENGNQAVTCSRGAVGSWEKFTVVNAGGGKISLKGNNGKYISSENGNRAVTCSRGAAASWEKFTMVNAGGGKVAFKGNNGKYISSENGATNVTCSRGAMGSWEKFTWKAE